MSIFFIIFIFLQLIPDISNLRIIKPSVNDLVYSLSEEQLNHVFGCIQPTPSNWHQVHRILKHSPLDLRSSHNRLIRSMNYEELFNFYHWICMNLVIYIEMDRMLGSSVVIHSRFSHSLQEAMSFDGRTSGFSHFFLQNLSQDSWQALLMGPRIDMRRWCSAIPPHLLSLDGPFSKINIGHHLNSFCLFAEYRGKHQLISLIHNQIDNDIFDDFSLANLLVSFHTQPSFINKRKNQWKNDKIITLYDQVVSIINTSTKSSNPNVLSHVELSTHFRVLMRMEVERKSVVAFRVTEALQPIFTQLDRLGYAVSANERVILLRLWLKMTPNRLSIRMLSSFGINWNEVSGGMLHELFIELFRNRNHVEWRDILEVAGIEEKELMIKVFGEHKGRNLPQWKQRKLNDTGRSFKLQYLRYFMNRGIDTRPLPSNNFETSIRPLRIYSSITWDQLQMRFSQLINQNNVYQVDWSWSPPLVRPRTWATRNQVRELITLLLYSWYHFDRPVGLIPRAYCNYLDHDNDATYRVLSSDFALVRKKKAADLPSNMTMTMVHNWTLFKSNALQTHRHVHKNAFEDIHIEWILIDVVFYYEELCWLFT